MRIRPFDYRVATSLADALSQLDRFGSDAKVIAGGTDLVLSMKKKKTLPRVVISLHTLRDLNFVAEDPKDSTLRIGALCNHADLAAHPLLGRRYPILCEAVGLIGSWQIRNVGTIGGNICTASPAADSVPPLLVLDADVVIATPQGENDMPLTSFFRGPGATVLEPNQILKEIRIKPSRNRSAGCYLKLRRRKAVDVSLAGVAFQAETDAAGERVNKVGIALGGVAPTPIRVPEAEALLTGLSLDEALQKIPECAAAAVDAAKPIDDVRASADYRRTIVDVFMRRGAQRVLMCLKNGGGR